MRFQVTYTRAMTLTQVIEAESVEEVEALAADEINFLEDIDFENVSTKYEIKVCSDEQEQR